MDKKRKAPVWFDKPKEKKMTPFNERNVQCGVIVLGGCIDQEVAKNYLPEDLKPIQKDGFIELWTEPKKT